MVRRWGAGEERELQEAEEWPIWGGQKELPTPQGQFSTLQCTGLTPSEPVGSEDVPLSPHSLPSCFIH